MAGLHGRTERGVRGVTVYLIPGLATWQRRAVIRRLRQEASRGFGPPLPLPQLAVALGLDRVRTTARIAGAIVRLHPAVTLVPGAFVVAMMTLFVLAAGDRPGMTPSPRGGLAAAVAASGIAQDVNAVPGPGRMALVTVCAGTGGYAGGMGLGSGQGDPAKQGNGKQPSGKQLARAPARPGAWYACPRAGNAPVPRPYGRQPACSRPAPRAVPHTAHLPGPLDLAR